MTNREWLEKLTTKQVRRIARQWGVSEIETKPPADLISELEVKEHIQDTAVYVYDEITGRILDYWNVDLQSTMTNPTHTASANNALCGDMVSMAALIKEDRIKELHFLARGCCISESSAAMLVEYFRGRTVKEALEFTMDQMLELVGAKIAPPRYGCLAVSLDCLQALCQHADDDHEEAQNKK